MTSIQDSSATLTCTFYGEALNLIHWQYEQSNDTTILVDTSNSVKYNTPTTISPSLIIRNVISGDTGFYQCVGTSINGSQVSGRVFLEVLTEVSTVAQG